MAGCIRAPQLGRGVSQHDPDPRRPPRLLIGAVSSAAIALLHVAIVVIGPAGYRNFGAPALAVAATQGARWPALITLALAAVFALWAAYAASALGALRRLPLLRPVLLLIGGVYALRGLLLVPELLAFVSGTLRYPRVLAFSSVAFVTGAAYLFGALAVPLPYQSAAKPPHEAAGARRTG